MNERKRQRIITALRETKIDAWLLYSFDGLNPIAEKVCGVSGASRQWFMLAHTDGSLKCLCQAIDAGYFETLGVEFLIYTNQESLREQLKTFLKGVTVAAMEYSPQCEIPYISKVDAGTIELLKVLSPQLEIISSAPLVQRCLTLWDDAGVASHTRALTHLHEIITLTWKKVEESMQSNIAITEYELQQFMMNEITKRGLETNHPPIVAQGEHAADPHYSPKADSSAVIERSQILMFDIWAREKSGDSIYADITWMGFTGVEVPSEILSIWNILTAARDTGLDFLKNKLESSEAIQGYEVDEVIRSYIIDKGYGEYFIHRTGHSIAHELHAEGVNIDSFELKDTREIISGCGFSIEPGIYLKGKYGFRSELDVYIDAERKVQVYGPIQKEILTHSL